MLGRADPLQHGQPARQRARRAASGSRATSTDAGLECELDGRRARAANLVATLAGDARRPGARLPAHVDTVLADPADWTHDPWAGELHDGFVWGRGALDMKSQTAAEAVARRALGARGLAAAARRAEALRGRRRGGRRRARRAVADPSSGPTSRAATSCSTRAAARSCPTATAASTASAAPRRARSASRSRTRGRAGHASVPALADNALLKLAPVLAAPRPARSAPYDLTEPPRGAARGPRRGPVDPAGAARGDRARPSRGWPRWSSRRCGCTFAPTIIAPREDQRDPRARRAATSTAAPRPGWTPTGGARARSRDVLGGRRSRSSSSSRSSATRSPRRRRR